MIDQSFSTHNLRIIYDNENRRGINLAEMFFPDVEALNNTMRTYRIERRRLLEKKARIKKSSFDRQWKTWSNKIDKLDIKREKTITDNLDAISSVICQGSFKVKINAVSGPLKKAIYTTGHDAYSYFAIKQILFNLSRLYKIKQGDRDSISNQLSIILSDSFPKVIIRTDFRYFYESIPRNKLLERINYDTLLSHPSKRVIRNILRQYADISHNSLGVPRGIGISAYLAELYLKDFDSALRSHPEVIYYARYVDDVVVIFTPSPLSRSTDYLALIADLAENYALKLNKAKTKCLSIPSSSDQNLDYLGYSYKWSKNNLSIVMSRKRYLRYLNRLKRCFELYSRSALVDEKSSRRLLFKRIRFLVSNTHLVSNKRRAKVGIYFSNRHITNQRYLELLDDWLLRLTQSTSMPRRAKTRLSSYSFVIGFNEQRYTQYKLNELAAITKAWHNA